jgi:DNA-binding MarR family transcriptional regulator
VNSSDAAQTAGQIEGLYRRLWGALHRPDTEGDLGQHERQLLAHIGEGASLTWVTEHLLLPKSTASVLVKDLARRGYLRRERDPQDERRLRITLTARGRQAVADDSVLDVGALAVALSGLPPRKQHQLIDLLTQLADAAEQTQP